MPELPEVETIVRDLQRLVVARRVMRVQVRLNKIVRTGPRRLANLLVGREILTVQRRGKFIVFVLSGDAYLVVHLKMTGQFLWGERSSEIPKHVHVVLGFEDNQVLMYRDMRQFGYWLGMDGPEYAAWLVEEEIGPDPFQVTADEFCQRLAGRRGGIKALLLNQKLVSGLGNIYVDESLFAAGIHPACGADQVERESMIQLHREMLAILKRAINHRGSSVRDYIGLTGVGGEFQNEHRVYGRSGEHCLICGEPLRRAVVAGRGTHFCPRCQPETRP